MVNSDSQLNQLHLTHAKSRLANQLPSSWYDKARLGIQYLGLDGTSKTKLAAHLHISPRTLQRRLEAEHTNYQKLLDDYKKEQALALIKHSDLAFKAIANELGFAEISTFYRAVKRWFNQTPTGLRQSRP